MRLLHELCKSISQSINQSCLGFVHWSVAMPARGFKCTWVNPVTGRPCGNPTVYTRRYNLQRHIDQRHKNADASTFTGEPRTIIGRTPTGSTSQPHGTPNIARTPPASLLRTPQAPNTLLPVSTSTTILQ
jgi:hypothetical protein